MTAGQQPRGARSTQTLPIVRFGRLITGVRLRTGRVFPSAKRGWRRRLPFTVAPPVWLAVAGTILANAPSVGALTAQEVYQEAANATVIVSTASSLGSGVLVARDLVATNCHVVKSEQQVKLLFVPQATGTQIATSGTVIARNEAHDLCGVRIEQHLPGSRPVTGFRSWASVKVGEPVYTLGAPVGLAYSFSDGIVAQKRESNGGKLIQFTAPISPGNSGGGLFDASGRLVGLTSFVRSSEGSVQNLNFAWSVDAFPDPLPSSMRGAAASSSSSQPSVRESAKPVSAVAPRPQLANAGWAEAWKSLFSQGDYRQALTTAASWTEAAPDRAEAWIARGRSAEGVAPGSGFPFFRRALECNHSHQDAMYYGALSAHKGGNSHDFRRLWRLLREANPRRADDLAAQVKATQASQSE